MRKDRSKHRGVTSPQKPAPESGHGPLSANSLSKVRRQMDEFDDLPAEVRAAVMSALEPSDQMIDVLCAMNRGGFSIADMLKVVTTSNARSGH